MGLTILIAKWNAYFVMNIIKVNGREIKMQHSGMSDGR